MNPKIPIANIMALKKITEKFSGKNIDWVLIGSTSLAIQGVNVEVHDIDIKTDVKNADKIADMLKEYAVEPMHHKNSSQFKSYYGLFKINNVQVEVIADLETMHEGEWIKVENSRVKVIKRYEDMTLPLLELKEEYETYKRMGRMDKANKIKEFIDKENNYSRRSGAS
jgi:hypothetical protein